MKPKILAIDTTTAACSAALLVGHDITEQYQIAPQQHAQLILPMIQKLLTENKLTLSQLDALAFSKGPGSFTGVRIGAGVIQGLAFGADLPVVPISTLQVLAQGAYTEYQATHVLPCLDARMHEVYWGIYQLGQDNIMQPIINDMLVAPENAAIPKAGKWLGVGNGWREYHDNLQKRLQSKVTAIQAEQYPHSKYVAQLATIEFNQGNVVTAEQALPVYLRNPF